jgi:Protein NO VEIN, C-terminal
MASNEWWLDDPMQKYWMEITGREDLGANLLAPQVADDGKPEWGYELVRFVKEGDVVLHWTTAHGQRALVAYSRVVGAPGTTTMIWQSRGTSGQAHPSPLVDEPAWTAPLGDFTYLPSPITREKLQMHRTAVLDLQARLKEAYGNASLYLPFYDYGLRELRATQAYLVKFPTQMLTLLSLDVVPEASAAKKAVEPSRSSRRGSGYLSDVELKRAIERHAVSIARNLCEHEGYDCDDVGATHSYDLRLRRGSAEIHVEVKGSTGIAETVELTSNEVSHAAANSPETHLIVVDQIETLMPLRHLEEGFGAGFHGAQSRDS